MIGLLVLGIILLLLGWLAPFPHPVGQICLIIGAICAVVAGVFLVIDLVSTAHYSQTTP